MRLEAMTRSRTGLSLFLRDCQARVGKSPVELTTGVGGARSQRVRGKVGTAKLVVHEDGLPDQLA